MSAPGRPKRESSLGEEVAKRPEGRPFVAPGASLADRLDALLPQTQCTQCGYSGCRPYAEAMASGEAPINRCPPGGPDGVRQLARLLGTTELPLDHTRGRYGPLEVAVIDEAHCIGCTLCIQACPVDAIVGANLRMHTVLEADCTGCALCVAPCPVDCIVMRPLKPETWWNAARADAARERFDQRRARLAWLHDVAHSRRPGAEAVADASATVAKPPVGSAAASGDPGAVKPIAYPAAPLGGAADAKRAAIAAALAKARERRRHVDR
ncbi:MAG: electron transport complex subunit RsxB [Pigmentiphaga sp.]|nr:electron transport complex subunit RsxB [Pigmentiphaga sp.]